MGSTYWMGSLSFSFIPGKDFANLEGETIGLGNAANLFVGVPCAQERGELTEAVETFVVDLDDEDVIEAF